MTDRCTYLTAAGAPCRRASDWRMVPAHEGEGCKQHVLAAARRRRALEIVHFTTNRSVKVTVAPPIRRKPFALPTTAAAAITALAKAQSLHEWSAIFRTAIANHWTACRATDPLYAALVNTKQRLTAAATPTDIATYNGNGLRAAS